MLFRSSKPQRLSMAQIGLKRPEHSADRMVRSICSCPHLCVPSRQRSCQDTGISSGGSLSVYHNSPLNANPIRNFFEISNPPECPPAPPTVRPTGSFCCGAAVFVVSGTETIENAPDNDLHLEIFMRIPVLRRCPVNGCL